ncbi:MAG: PIN domain-containing protein [Planctomycetaceae bacterium]
MIVGIDSMILIYAGSVPKSIGTAASERAQLTLRAKLLLHQLSDDTIILPSIAVAELLVPIPDAQRGLLIAELSSRFVCKPFDLPATAIAADLWARSKKLPAELRHDNRNVLKSDVMIIAVAKAAGATVFYSHDRRCRAIAALVMEAKDMPTHSEDLFLPGDIERGEA